MYDKILNMKIINKIHMVNKQSFLKTACLSIISLVLVFSVCFGYAIRAFADINGNDKLYGESFSQREMSVKYCPNVSSQYACLMDKNGTIIYERNAYEGAKIASMTKIMTAIVSLENANLDDQITISEKAVKVGESSAGFWVGDKLDVKSALYALLVPSGNDAAEALCNYVGQKLIDNKDDKARKKSVDDVKREAQEQNKKEEEILDVYYTEPDDVFVKLMNDKAAQIGCTNTYFSNPHGLDNDEYDNKDQRSCAADVAKFTRYAMQNDTFRQIVAGGSTSINVDRNGVVTVLPLQSTDQMIGNYEGCIGVKTGITDTAGPCFSGACLDKSGIEIYTVIMHAKDEASRFIDTQNLFNWYYTNKFDVKLTDTNDKQTMTVNGEQKEVGVVAYVADGDWVNCAIPVTLEDQNQIVPVLKFSGNVHFSLEANEVHGDFKAGDKVCEIVLTQHNKEIARLNLVAVKDQPAPNVFQMIGVGIDRISKSITNQPTVAESKIVYNNDDLNKL